MRFQIRLYFLANGGANRRSNRGLASGPLTLLFFSVRAGGQSGRSRTKEPLRIELILKLMKGEFIANPPRFSKLGLTLFHFSLLPLCLVVRLDRVPRAVPS